MLTWWEHLIVCKYETHGLTEKGPAALACLSEIAAGRWRVFAYERERTVAIVGPCNMCGAGEVHIWADGGNLLRAGRIFMGEVWDHVPYIGLIGMFANPRVEKLAQRLGWQPIGEDANAHYWMATRVAS